jgi:hypothetical protein
VTSLAASTGFSTEEHSDDRGAIALAGRPGLVVEIRIIRAILEILVAAWGKANCEALMMWTN